MKKINKYRNLLCAIALKNLDYLKKNIKSINDLRLCGKQGVSILSFLSKKGLLGEVNPTLLSKELLGEYDKHGMNAYTYAGQNSTISHIPPTLWDDKVLSLQYKSGPDVFGILQHEGQLKYLPKHCFTKEILFKKRKGLNPRIVGLAYSSQLGVVPKKLLTPEVISKGGAGTEGHNSLLHIAAKGGCLNDIPAYLLTEENLLAKDIYGNTVIHTAAYHGHLKQIPKNFLTKANILEKNAKGATVIHNAIIGTCLEEIPIKLITKKTLWMLTSRKENALTLLNERLENHTCAEVKKYYGNEFHDRVKTIWKTLDTKDLIYAKTLPGLLPYCQTEEMRRKVNSKEFQESAPFF
jgi:hypothetical protein